MYRSQLQVLLVAVFSAFGWPATIAHGQEVARPAVGAAATAAPAGGGQAKLDSDEWLRINRMLSDWLSVQQVYRPKEVESVLADMRKQIEGMSPQELRVFLTDLEKRLQVLLSPEAEDARTWLNQFTATAVDPEARIGRSRPDVLNMTASQIRQEILWLQQHRERSQQAQAAFERTRDIQTQLAGEQREARNAARQPVDRSNWPANTPPVRSQYLPNQHFPPAQPSGPVYRIGPWGTTYFIINR